MLLVLDHIGVLVFAISGMLTAADRNLDVLGGYIIAFITALGGGTIRDLLLNVDIAWMNSVTHLITVFIGGTIGLIFQNLLRDLRRTFFIFDTLGIATFTILGVQKGMESEQFAVTAIFLGMISATFGGLIRDVLCNEIPLIFRKEIYAIPCLLGGSLYFLGDYFGYGGQSWLLWSSATFIALFRTFAVIFTWKLPLIKEIN
ncbi:MAG: trimeric intracellular cation channel family protein [Brumimicrobium sp.]